MKIIDTAIADVKIIEPAVFGDERGFSSKVSTRSALKKPSAQG
jgi:dTDP-4-dehydrorhamnose 3,5-epimerase